MSDPAAQPPDPAGEPAPRRRGRPRSAASHAAVLRAAAALLEQSGWPGFSVDEVARRSGISKSVIYTHWNNGLEIALEAVAERLRERVPVPDTGDVAADLTEQARALAAAYSGTSGALVTQLLGAAMSVGDSETLRRGFFANRRADTIARIERAQAAGQLPATTDPELVVDVLFGGIVFRLVSGRGAFDAAGATDLARLALHGIVTP